MLKPQKRKGDLLRGWKESLWNNRHYSLKLTVCVVYIDALPAISLAWIIQDKASSIKL